MISATLGVCPVIEVSPHPQIRAISSKVSETAVINLNTIQKFLESARVDNEDSIFFCVYQIGGVLVLQIQLIN